VRLALQLVFVWIDLFQPFARATPRDDARHAESAEARGSFYILECSAIGSRQTSRDWRDGTSVAPEQSEQRRARMARGAGREPDATCSRRSGDAEGEGMMAAVS
jgi:hypothetical protein